MSIEQFQNSILLFDKPYRWTSFDVVNKIRRVLKVKIGHAGTLDPLATGLLILCTGKERKNMVSFQGLEKEYTGTMRLGATTPSYDNETEVDQTFDISHVTKEMILSGTEKFIGTHDQLPPSYSAKQIEGKRYYQYARKGKEFEMKTHSVTLNGFEITRIELPDIDFKIVCEKGYYVRSLVYDFGKLLDAGAYLTSLCRTRIGEHELKDAWQIKDFVNFVKPETELNAGS
jgi:tRNA pseudouridine55 synthase